MDKGKNKINLDEGHRERLRNLIIENYDTVTKEKIFEYLLCLAIPRRDLRIFSKSILEKGNGNISQIINKDYDYLKNTLFLSKPTIAAIFTVRKIMSFCNQEELLNNNKFDSRQNIIEFLQKEIGFKDTEHIIILFLNSSQQLIEKKIFKDKHPTLTNFNISEVIATALNNNSKYLVISHNHPSNNVNPSSDDRITTFAFEETIRNINKFELIDHIIVSPKKYYSFYEHNLLKSAKKI